MDQIKNAPQVKIQLWVFVTCFNCFDKCQRLEQRDLQSTGISKRTTQNYDHKV